LAGGVGGVAGTLIGGLLIAVLRNGSNLLGVDPFDQNIYIGLLIIGAVALDQRLAARPGLRRRGGALNKALRRAGGGTARRARTQIARPNRRVQATCVFKQRGGLAHVSWYLEHLRRERS
jgi:predicted lipid-binding transport protein (Tim44 family)